MNIRENWEEKTLGQVITFTGGSQPPLIYFSKIEHQGYIRLIQIRDYKTDKYLTYIPQELARRFCNDDDIMIGRYGPPIFQILKGLEGAYNVALIKATPKSEILKDFAWHFLRNEKLFNHIDKLSRRTSGQTGVDLLELENYLILLPPKPEQEKIAKALSDTDAYIDSLEKLIAKKQLIKEGLMANLLTGKERLAEFAYHEDGSKKGYKESELGLIPEDWKIVKLGDYANFTKGYGLSKDGLELDGKYPCIHYGQLFTTYNENIDNIISYTNYSGLVKSRSNDVLMPTSDVTPRGLAKASCIEFDSVVLGGDILVIRSKHDSINGIFLSYMIRFMKEQIMKLVRGSTVYHIYAQDMSKFTFALPSIEEQEHIIKLLTSISQEIEKLSSKLTKAKSIKQGMMQKLLTGEIRLINPHSQP